jgi:SET family sugar efflux transporter-like MFS transporter
LSRPDGYSEPGKRTFGTFCFRYLSAVSGPEGQASSPFEHSSKMIGFLSSGTHALRQRGFLGLLASTAALGMGFSFVSPFLSIWGTQEVGMSPLMFGTFMTVVASSAIIVSTTLARWSDTHLSRRTMLILGSLGGAVGYTGYALIRDPLILVVIGGSCLALASVCFSQLFAHVREIYATGIGDGPRPELLVSMVRACFSVAWTVGPAIGAWMMVQYGFEGVFLGAAALYLLFFFGVLRFVAHQPRTAESRSQPRQPVWQILTRRDIFAVFVAFLLVFAAFAMNTMNLPLLITQVLGGTGKQVGIAFCIGPIVEIPLMLWFGQLAARGHQLNLIRIGALFAALYFVALTLAQAPWHIYPIQVLSGVVFAIITNVAILFFQDLLPGQAGLATTIFSNAGNVGNLAGYFGFGALLTSSGHRGVIAVCATLATAMLIILLAYRPRQASASNSAETR